MNTVTSSKSTTLDPILMTMDLVDTLRREQSDNEALLDNENNDAALVEKVRVMYESQGITVSDAVIVDAVKALKEKRFSYTPPLPSLSTRLATLYIKRAIVLKYARYFLLATAIFSASWIGINVSIDRLHEYQAKVAQVKAAQELAQDTNSAKAQLANKAALNNRANALETTLNNSQNGPFMGEKIPGKRLLTQAIQGLSEWTSPETSPSWAGGTSSRQALLKKSENALGTIASLLNQAQEQERLAGEAVQLKSFFETSRSLLTDARMKPALEKMAREGLGLIEKEDVKKAQSLAHRMKTLSGMGTAWGDLEKAVTTWPENARNRVSGVLQQGLLALTTANEGVLKTAIEQLKNTQTELNLSYQLFISDRPGQKSGVRRTSNDPPYGNNYYIVVDAKDMAGADFNLPITSIEDGRVKTTHHFAVRVPQSVYETVKKDKQDNGIIDHRLFATKTAGTLDPDYSFAVEGGSITSW